MIKDKKIIHNKDIAASLDPDPGMAHGSQRLYLVSFR